MDEEKLYEECDTNSVKLAHILSTKLVDGEDFADTQGCPPLDNKGDSWDAYGGCGQPSTEPNRTKDMRAAKVDQADQSTTNNGKQSNTVLQQ